MLLLMCYMKIPFFLGGGGRRTRHTLWGWHAQSSFATSARILFYLFLLCIPVRMPTTSESLSNIRNPHSCKTNTTTAQGQGGGSPQQGPEFYISDKAERTQKEIQCSQQHYKEGDSMKYQFLSVLTDSFQDK